MSSLAPALVLDNGSGCLKAGFAGEAFPLHTLPTCVGQGRDRQRLNQNLLYGDELLISSNYFCLRPTSSASSPLFSDLELLRDLWEVLFCHKKYLGFSDAALSSQGVVVTEPLLTPAGIRDALSEILFEDFKFNQVLFAPTQQSVPFAFLGSRVQEEEQDGTCGDPHRTAAEASTLHAEKSLGIVGNCSRYSGPKEEKELGRWVPSRGGVEDGAEQAGQGQRPATNGGEGGPQLSSQSLLRDGLEQRSHRSGGASMHLAGARPPSSTHFLAGRREGQFFSGLVVDCGFSGTTVMPYVDLRPVERATLRSGVGGNLLTTVLKNLCGFRSVNLERNELLVQHIKESCCFVSEDFERQLLCARSEAEAAGGSSCIHRTHLFCEFELPEYGTLTRAALLSYFARSPQGKGTARRFTRIPPPSIPGAPLQTPPDPPPGAPEDPAGVKSSGEGRQVVRLCTERITVPEVLFRPQDAGSTECGVVELVQRSVSLLPRELQPFACGEILLVGGTSKFPGMRERLWKDLRSSLPQHWPVNIYMEDDPEFSVWRGASFSYSDRALFDLNALTRQQFEESGNAKRQASHTVFE